MFLDAFLLLSDAQAVSVDAVSTNTIDLGNPTVKNRIGSGEPMAILITVDVSADGTTGDETYAFEVIQSANANLSSADVLVRRAFLAGQHTQLVAGTRLVLGVPPGTPTKRYLGVNYDVGGTTPSITVTAALMPQSMAEESVTHYAKGYTV
jgi:hypothetical protein